MTPRTPLRLAGFVPIVVAVGLASLALPARTGPADRRAAATACPRAPGTAAMVERLARIAAETPPRANRFMNRKNAAELRLALDRTPDPGSQVPLRLLLALELLNAGLPEEALAEIEPVAAMWDGVRQFLRPGTDREVREMVALAWLRIGEQSNCILHHGTQSCLAPIQGDGIHRDPIGSRRALAGLREILAVEPRNLRARWLLNVAAMTVGEWPHRVEPDLLVPPAAFASEADIGRFPEVAVAAGIATRGLAGGAVTEDLDGDGDIDVLFTHMGFAERPVLFRNQGDGSFVECGAQAGLEGLTGGLNVTHADYDNDGDVDLFVPRGAWMHESGLYPNSLLRNRGDGSFEDVTEEAGLLTFHPTQVAAWADYDGDGWLDLFVGNESEPGMRHPSELWRNRGDGSFEDRTGDLPRADLGYVKGAAWGDYDNDGRPDLHVSVYFGDDVLLHNEGPRDGGWTLRDVTAEAGALGPHESFANWWFDYDGDGWEDLFVTGYYAPGVGDVAAMLLGLPHRARMPKLLRNLRDGTFEDVTARVRLDRVALPMGANFGDLDNDGSLDCYFATGEPGLATLMPNRMFRNDGGRTFQDVTTSGGFGHLQKGHGVAFADLDGDGDQDVVTEMGGAFEGDGAFSVLFENPGQGNRWITLRLEGRRANRSAIGARIRARLLTADGPREVYLTAGTGGSFGSSSLQQEMGLGRALALDELEVVWPGSGTRHAFRDVAMDAVYRLVEGHDLERVEVVPVKLGGGRRADFPPR